MKILIVASYNKGYFSPFITEQAQALADAGCEIRYFGVVGHGLFGYLKHIRALRQYIRKEKPDFVHAHYGLCGLLAHFAIGYDVCRVWHKQFPTQVETLVLGVVSNYFRCQHRLGIHQTPRQRNGIEYLCALSNRKSRL